MQSLQRNRRSAIGDDPVLGECRAVFEEPVNVNGFVTEEVAFRHCRREFFGGRFGKPLVRTHHGIGKALNDFGVFRDVARRGVEAPGNHGAAENLVAFIDLTGVCDDTDEVVAFERCNHRVKVCEGIDLAGAHGGNCGRRSAHADKGDFRGFHTCLTEHEVCKHLRA